MTSVTFCTKQKLKLGRECLLQGDAFSRGMAGAETYDLSPNWKSRKRRSRKHQQEVLSALAPGGGYQSSWGTLLLVFGEMKRDAVPGMSINGHQGSV